MSDQNLTYAIRLNSSGFQSGLRSATQSLSAFRIGLANALVNQGFAIVQRAVAKFSQTLRSSLDLSSELVHLSAETGASVSNLLVLRQAFQDCGVGAGALATSVSFMNRALSGISENGQRTEAVFAKLGLDMGELRRMAPADAFEAIGRAIGGLSSPAERTAAAMAVFGRSGSALNRVFSNPDAIKQARDALGSMPAIMAANAKSAEAWQTAVGRVQTQIQGGVMGALSSLLPVLDSIAQKTASIDFAQIGVNIGVYLKQLWEGGLIGLFNQLAARCNVIGVAVWEAIKMAFAPLFKAETWKSLGLLLGGALLDAAGLLSKAFTSIVAVLTAGIEKAVDYLLEGISYIPGLGDLAPTENKSFSQHYDDAMKALSWTYQPAMDMGSDLMSSGMQGAADAWKGAFDGWADAVLNSSGAQYLDALRQEREAMAELALQQAKAAEQAERVAEVQGTAAGGEGGGGILSVFSKIANSAVDSWAKVGATTGRGATGANGAVEVAKKHLMVANKHTDLMQRSAARLEAIQKGIAMLEATT